MKAQLKEKKERSLCVCVSVEWETLSLCLVLRMTQTPHEAHFMIYQNNYSFQLWLRYFFSSCTFYESTTLEASRLSFYDIEFHPFQWVENLANEREKK